MNWFQNTKTFSLKSALKIGQKKFLLLEKLKKISVDLCNYWFKWWRNSGGFYEKKLKKTSQKEYTIEKVKS